MKTIFQHIEHAKARPHHERRRITVVAASVVAVVIGVAWAGSSLATGGFAIQGSDFAESVGAKPVIVKTPDGNAQVAGAAEALDQKKGDTARIEIIDASTSTAPSSQQSQSQPQQTVIPF